MVGYKLWIVDFQYTDEEVIRSKTCCVTGRNIKDALENAEELIMEYMGEAAETERVMITNAGLAAVQDDVKNINKIWESILNDPDPELFG